MTSKTLFAISSLELGDLHRVAAVILDLLRFDGVRQGVVVELHMEASTIGFI